MLEILDMRGRLIGLCTDDHFETEYDMVRIILRRPLRGAFRVDRPPTEADVMFSVVELKVWRISIFVPREERRMYLVMPDNVSSDIWKADNFIDLRKMLPGSCD